MNDYSALLLRLRYRWSLQGFVSELLLKKWMEPIIPFILMVILILVFGLAIENYFNPTTLADTARELVEYGFVTIAMGITIISGGIDLSVSSMFAMGDMFTLILFKKFCLPVPIVFIATLAVGGIMGAANGLLIGFMKTRAFLTTLVTMIIYRSFVTFLDQSLSVQIATSDHKSAIWDFLGGSTIIGVPTNVVALLILLIIGHVILTRSRPGWRMTAIGSGRRAARHAGISIEKIIFFTYVTSGVLSAMGGFFYGTRLNAATSDTGVGMEIIALTAAVLGGVSLSGGKGTVARMMIGVTIVVVLSNGLVRLGYTGDSTNCVLGVILLLGVGIDVKWLRNLSKTVQKIYIVPTYVELPPIQDARLGSGTVFAANYRLTDAEPIALGQVDGPEDVIIDRQGYIYGSCRAGWIVRIPPDDFSKVEVFARTGGRPLGMAFDKDDNLIVCIGGMGLYGVRPDGEIYKLTDETNRTWWKVQDDSRLRLADDLDIAPDGKIYFSEATIRYEMENWILDGLECRGNGRIVCYDPATGKTRTVVRNISFPNGVCVSHDGQSVLYAQTWLCRVMRYWIAGPKKGKVETLIPSLPFYADNINRGSGGHYWLASAGMLTTTFRLGMMFPGFRRGMIKRVPPDEWTYPNLNMGCCVRFTEEGEVLESFYDYTGKAHATVTSVREDRGYLYLAGLFNNRIGRIKLKDTDSNWTGPESYWGKK